MAAQAAEPHNVSEGQSDMDAPDTPQHCNHAHAPLSNQQAGAQPRRARAAAARYDRNMSNTRRDSPDSSANVYSAASAACAAANAAALAGGTCTPTSSTVERLPAARPRRKPCQLINVSFNS